MSLDKLGLPDWKHLLSQNGRFPYIKKINKVKCKVDYILNGIITCFNLHMLHVMLSRDFL